MGLIGISEKEIIQMLAHSAPLRYARHFALEFRLYARCLSDPGAGRAAVSRKARPWTLEAASQTTSTNARESAAAG